MSAFAKLSDNTNWVVVEASETNQKIINNVLKKYFITKKTDDKGRYYFLIDTFQMIYKETNESINYQIDEFLKRVLYGLHIAKSHFQTKNYISKKPENIEEVLMEKGFKRNFLPTQLRDIELMINNPHSGNFSVPGAGKTTTMLGLNKLLEIDNLMIVVPNSIVMDSWQEEVEEYMKENSYTIFRINNNNDFENVLNSSDKNKLILITYSRILQDKAIESIRKILQKYEVHMVLDESHRIKGAISRNVNNQSKTGENILKISKLPFRRDILTGTPVPNSEYDLISQFEFLYPTSGVIDKFLNDSNQEISSHIESFYSRTTKDELELPKSNNINPFQIEMSLPQAALYEMIVSKYRKLLLKSPNKGIDAIRNAPVRQIWASVDHFGLVNKIDNKDDELYEYFSDLEKELFKNIKDEGKTENQLSPKMKAVVEQVTTIYDSGEQAIVWSNFTSVIDALSNEFSQRFNIDSEKITLYGQTDEPNLNIKLFNQKNNDYRVLVANPQSGGEGISLHKNCSNAIYIDRNYNAAKYIQSRDRIHRVGSPFAEVNFFFYESIHPRKHELIDRKISENLSRKLALFNQIFKDKDIFKMQEFEDEIEAIEELEMSQNDIDAYIEGLLDGKLF